MSEHELWNELGNLYFMSGAYNQAIFAYQRSIQLDSNFGRPYSNLALTFVQQGKNEQAVELYRRSIELLAEDQEKAISWNRLGNVYRQLKDYHKAVVAYQLADELDPESAQEREEPGQLLYAGSDASSVTAEPGLGKTDSGSQDDQDSPVASTPDKEGPAAASPDSATASWTPADPSQYQQDMSESPETGSLTTWADSDFDDDDSNLYSPLEPETEVYIPDTDSDDLTKWLPIPEEPQDESKASVLVEDTPEKISQPYMNHATYYQDVEPTSLALSLPTGNNTRSTREYSEQNAQQTTEVDVEEPPSAAFVLAAEPEDELLTTQPQKDEVESERPSLESSEEEINELEAEIAKFKRVVQINPRNAYAWDALGTLYKSICLYKDSILAYQQAISIDASKAVYHHHLGLVYACEGRDEDAMSAFQKVIEIDPDYSLAHATLGGYYRKLGLEELAQKHIGKAMKNIFDSENEYNRACLEAICGNADQAIELLRIALKNKQTYVDWILRDPDLDFIRQDPRFKQLISDYTR